MAILYAILIVGAVTTVYPFLLMVSTGFKGPTDQNDNKLVPTYWSDIESKDPAGALKPESLLGKYVDDKYRGDAGMRPLPPPSALQPLTSNPLQPRR